MTQGLRRTKIVCTIGPATSSPEMVDRLVAAGMDAARLNFSHGTHEEHGERARLVREAQARAGRPLALIADLQGPKVRVGDLEAPRILVEGDEVTVVGGANGADGDLPVRPAVLTEVLLPGHEVLIDDGLVRLRVDEVDGERVRTTVLVGGAVGAHKGVNVPGVPIPVPTLTEKDLADLEFALSVGVDYVALSFVRSASDCHGLRELLNAADAKALVIAKIEKGEALEELDSIVSAADAVMVARGDLGVEIGPAAVPLVQKRVITSALEHGKPAITATQMLESMISRPEPTRAEASDVANAVLDGTSALMLSGETAVGQYPVESVAFMDRISRAIEPSLPYRHELAQAADQPFPTVGEAMSNAACDIAEVLGATAILVPTFSGRTASAVARHRPRRPIIAVTHRRHAVQQLALEWGVVPAEMEEAANVEDLWARSITKARETGLVAPGDRVVLTAGTAVNVPGTTNVIRVETA
ncbi:MAG TPA: pyruvate kinase [Gaiella sp.]